MSLPGFEIHHHHQNGLSSHFDPTSSHDDFIFLDQILSSVPSSFHWDLSSPAPSTADDPSLPSDLPHHFSDQSTKALILSRGPPNQENDASLQALYNGFTESLGQTQHFRHPQGHASEAPLAAASAPAAAESESGRGGAAGQPRQRVRARRGQATDPHSIAERLRRERIAERMKGLQELLPNANKTDKASMLDEIIDYVKFLQLQVKVLSMSRLGGTTGIPQSHLVVPNTPSQGSSNRKQIEPLTNNNKTTMTDDHVITKLLEEDMGSAMQYLQGKGLCLMPISLATAISTATGRSRNPMDSINSNNNIPLVNGDESFGTSSTSRSALAVQSTTIGNVNRKESTEPF